MPFPSSSRPRTTTPDRDETVGPNKPFRDLAVGLGGKGVACLRYDKRTKVHGSKMAGVRVTVKEETIDDALAALEAIRTQKEIAGTPVYLLGHTLGAVLAPEIARADGRLSGVIMVAAAARPFEEILLEQFEYVLGLSTGEESRRQLEEIRGKVKALRGRSLEPGEVLLGADAAYWCDLCDRDADVMLKTAAALECRILAIQGGRDYQATTEDFELVRKALADHPAATCKVFANLNHLLAPGKGKATPGEYLEPKYVDPRVIDLIAGWCTGAR